MANNENDGRRDDGRRGYQDRDNRGWDRPEDDFRRGRRDERTVDAPRGYGAGQDETGWASGDDRWSRRDQQREYAASPQRPAGSRGYDPRDPARDMRGSPMGDRDRGGGYGARAGYSGPNDWADSWRGGRGREYDQYTGMTSEPGYGAAYGAAGARGASAPMPRGRAEYEGREDERGFWDRATDEVSSWFGDEEAERRREQDRMHAGRGPRGYTRSDERIREDVCDRLTVDPRIDATDIEVVVANREVTLNGHVARREDKRRAEDCVESVAGVQHVQNNLRVKPDDRSIGVTGAGVTTSDTPPVGSMSEGSGILHTPGVGAGMSPKTPPKSE